MKPGRDADRHVGAAVGEAQPRRVSDAAIAIAELHRDAQRIAVLQTTAVIESVVFGLEYGTVIHLM